MKTLIVDDNTDKVRNILNVLIDSGLDEERDIDIAYCVRDAVRLLENNDYGLMILDLYLPIRMSEAPRIDGGACLLRELGRKKNLRRPEHILGLTSHEDAKIKAEPDFNKGLWTVVSVSPSSNDWKEVIVEKVRYLIARNSNLNSDIHPKCDLLFICALRNPELSQLKKAISPDWTEINLPNDASAYFQTIVDKGNEEKLTIVAVAAPSMGMTAAATLATKACLKFKPNVLVMTGICAGREGEIELGECLVASITWDYGSGKFFGKTENHNARFQASPYQLAVDPIVQTATESVMSDQRLLDEIHDKFNGNTPNRRLNITFAPMASGAAVQADAQFFESIVTHQHRKVAGIDMEAFGVCWAARETFEPRPIFFVCKGVSDFANENKTDDIQSYCSFTSAAIALEIVKRIPLRN